MGEWLKRFLTDAGTWLARPWAFAFVAVYAALWLYYDSRTFGWHGFAVLATLFMTLFIQRSEHRDTQALHAKLDELLRANGEAESRLTKLDKKEPEQIESYREAARVGD